MVPIAKSFVARQGGIHPHKFALTYHRSIRQKVAQLVMCKEVVCSMKVFRDTYMFEGNITLLNRICSWKTSTENLVSQVIYHWTSWFHLFSESFSIVQQVQSMQGVRSPCSKQSYSAFLSNMKSIQTH